MTTFFEILYAFKNDTTYLLELKRTDLEEATLHWLLIKDKVEGLNFKRMATTQTLEIREFEQGLLKFNNEQGDLQKITGGKIIFKKIPAVIASLPEDVVDQIYHFFRLR